MLALLFAASLGAQACAPLGTLAQEALGQTPTSAEGSSDPILCSIILKGDAATGANIVQVADTLDRALAGDGWIRNLAADADGPGETAAGYDRADQGLAVTVSQEGRPPNPTYKIVLTLSAAQQKANAPTPIASAGVLDPSCLANTAWAVDPAADKIQVFGCRPLRDIPAPDAEGFVNYTRPAVGGQDGGFTRAKPLGQAPAGQVAFIVQDNTGGSFTAQATVTGVLGGDGFMEAEGLAID